MTTLVVGLGLLGSSVLTKLTSAGRTARTVSVPWADTRGAVTALSQAAAEAASVDPDWDLAWCAGAGVVATSPAELADEVAVFSALLANLAHPPRVLFLSSSAGGVYAGSQDRPPFSEASRVAALAPYGEAKLEMESAAGRFAATGTRVVIGRFANLYGPGQNLSKPQGLVSQLCVTQILHRPLGIYVSFDTLRDYLYVADAAAMVVGCLDRAGGEPPGTVVTKVLATGRAASIGELIHVSTRVFRARPLISQRANPNASRQIRDLRLRSAVWPELDRLARTSMLVGLRATAEDVAARYRAAGTRLIAG